MHVITLLYPFFFRLRKENITKLLNFLTTFLHLFIMFNLGNTSWLVNNKILMMKVFVNSVESQLLNFVISINFVILSNWDSTELTKTFIINILLLTSQLNKSTGDLCRILLVYIRTLRARYSHAHYAHAHCNIC